jgi:hypothetical protein
MRAVCLILAFVAAAPAAALAQDASLDTPRGVQPVFVRGIDGVETHGRLIDFGPASLSLFVDGARRELPLDSIDRIQTRGDSVRNGALIGAAVGVGLWSLTAAEYGGDVPFVFFWAASYGALGALVDLMIPGRTTIYAKPAAVASAPAGKRAGLAFKIRF